jgi:hypothetical protein
MGGLRVGPSAVASGISYRPWWDLDKLSDGFSVLVDTLGTRVSRNAPFYLA